ncbi:DUF6676 family protein [[Mycobacterium] burgundiense]|uniref:Uncharacterized protein n=1 Tax=[Mycobacterium] burgundiense TaxID=3064286 RepID=A0ABN9ND71_9MYCO|nr:DUF6676 family protein [Mycolicibacterium sp. MU0053]CAJ1504471.1 hypothetical protein MU0053_002693 [Mycolicibacterium sp. MU0053]
MLGPETLPLLPYAPVLPVLPAYIPPDVDMDVVLAEVAADGVSADPADEAGLQQVVAQAQGQGIDLKVVVIDTNPPIDTPLRDIATVVAQSHPDATVLVLSPSFAGTHSQVFDRVTLEAGEDLAKTGNPVQSAQNFVDQLNTPDFPWTGLTIVLTVGVLLAAVVTRFLQVRAKAIEEPKPQADTASAASE